MFWRRQRYLIKNGHHTTLGVKKLRAGSWSWRIWRTHDQSLVMSGHAYTRKQALDVGDTWRRIDARQHGRHPDDV